MFFAIQEAVSASCQEVGEKYSYSMDSPATCERIRMACSDHITKQVIIMIVATCEVHSA